MTQFRLQCNSFFSLRAVLFVSVQLSLLSAISTFELSENEYAGGNISAVAHRRSLNDSTNSNSNVGYLRSKALQQQQHQPRHRGSISTHLKVASELDSSLLAWSIEENAPAAVLNRNVEFFAHIMHTGGTAWSRWLAAVFGASNIAPGSATASELRYTLSHASDFKRLASATQKCSENPACTSPDFKAVFGTLPLTPHDDIEPHQ